MNEIHDNPVSRRIAHGESALAELFREHAQTLYNLAVRVLHPASDAGGAVVELFLSLRAESHALPMAHATVREELISRMRDLISARTSEGARRYQTRDVDLWSVVSRPIAEKEIAGGSATGTPHSAAAARWILRKAGSVSSTVLSLVYFGGLDIASAAARLSISPAECRSRLHGCLESLSVDGHARPAGPPDHARFYVCSSAHSLGAITAADEPDYFHHLGSGCRKCDADIARFAAAAHILPLLLPDVKLPGDLSDRLHASLKQRTTPVASTKSTDRPETVIGIPAPEDGVGTPVDKPGRNGAPGRHRAPKAPRRGLRVMAVVAGLVAIASLGIYTNTLRTRLDEQANIIDGFQERQTDLVLERDALAGISTFFESSGIVTVLAGSDGAAGKLVWDTTLGRGMLQLINFPVDARGGKFQVRAAGNGLSMPVAEFRVDSRDTGRISYRFFEAPKGVPFTLEAVTVVASVDDVFGPGDHRAILEGWIAIPR